MTWLLLPLAIASPGLVYVARMARAWQLDRRRRKRNVEYLRRKVAL